MFKKELNQPCERLAFFKQVQQRIAQPFNKKTKFRMNLCKGFLTGNILSFITLFIAKNFFNLSFEYLDVIGLWNGISIFSTIFIMCIFQSQSDTINDPFSDESYKYLINNKLLHLTYLNKEEIHQLFDLNLTQEENQQLKTIIMNDKHISLYKLYLVFQTYIDADTNRVIDEITEKQQKLNLQHFLKENNLTEQSLEPVKKEKEMNLSSLL